MKTNTVKLNTIYNLIGSILPIAVTLVTVPVYIKEIGDAKFGILSIIWLLLGFFGLFDLGLSRATTNKLAELPADAVLERVKVFWTALYVNFGLGLIGAAILYFCSRLLFIYVFSISEQLQSELLSSVPWIALGIPLVTVTGVLVGTLDAYGEFLTANLLQIVGTVLFQVLPLLAAIFYSKNLSVLIGVAVISRAISALLLGYVTKKLVIPGGVRGIDFGSLSSLLKYGIWITVTNAISPILVSADQFVIASILGTATVAQYSIAFNAVNKLTNFPLAISRALFPKLSHTQTPEQAHKVANDFLIIIAIFMALACSCGIILSRPLFTLWLNNSIAVSCSTIAEILMVGIWINSLAFAPYTLLQGQRRPDIIAKFHAAELLPFVAILFIFVREFGVEGAACAWGLRMLADTALLLGAAGYPLKQWAGFLPGALMIGTSFLVVRFDQTQGIEIRAIALLLTIMFGIAWAAVAPTPIRLRLQSLRTQYFR